MSIRTRQNCVYLSKTIRHNIDFNKVTRVSSEIKLKESFLITRKFNEHKMCVPFEML